jgi:hypothetical protein
MTAYGSQIASEVIAVVAVPVIIALVVAGVCWFLARYRR